VFFIFCMHFLFSVGNICSIFFLYISWGFCHVNYWGGGGVFFFKKRRNMNLIPMMVRMIRTIWFFGVRRG
jgi:hypothetical protein